MCLISIIKALFTLRKCGCTENNRSVRREEGERERERERWLMDVLILCVKCAAFGQVSLHINTLSDQ